MFFARRIIWFPSEICDTSSALPSRQILSDEDFFKRKSKFSLEMLLSSKYNSISNLCFEVSRSLWRFTESSETSRL